MRFQVNNNKVFFWVCKIEKKTMELQLVSVLNVKDSKVNDRSLEDPTLKYKGRRGKVINKSLCGRQPINGMKVARILCFLFRIVYFNFFIN